MIKAYRLNVIENYNALLNDNVYNELLAERGQKVDSYKREKDKLLSLATGYLLNVALKNLGVQLNDVKLSETEKGKPYFVSPSNLFISISHSGDYAFLALSDSEIGIDVQQIKQVQSGLIEKTLTKLERESLQEKEQFFTFWSVKESYLKLIGTGLSAGLKNVEFNLQNGNISFNQKPQKVKTHVEEQNNYIFSIVAENLTDKILIENVKI